MIASVYLLKRIIYWRQLSCINFPPKINHYEASSANRWISITLFLRGLNLLFTAFYAMGRASLVFFAVIVFIYLFSCSIFNGSSFIGLISSISAGKSVMETPQQTSGLETRPWTKEEDQKLFECKSNRHLSWPEIAMLTELERSRKRCRERWEKHLDISIEFAAWSWIHLIVNLGFVLCWRVRPINFCII